MPIDAKEWLGPLDAQRCEIEVFTFKEGVLSAIAHDLRIRVGRVSGDVTAERARVVAEAASLSVVCARAHGEDAPATLSASDRGKIEATLREEVLEAGRFAEIAFEASVPAPQEDTVRVTGTLRLHGVSRPMTMELRVAGDVLRGEVSIHQPDFGIRPYRAMLGTLKVQADVRVSVTLRRRASPPGGAAAPR